MKTGESNTQNKNISQSGFGFSNHFFFYPFHSLSLFHLHIKMSSKELTYLWVSNKKKKVL